MKVEQFNVLLPEDLASRIHDAVEGGDYSSSSDIVREALLEWDRKRAYAGYSIDQLRALIAEGEASPIAPWEGAEAIIAEARRRGDRPAKA